MGALRCNAAARSGFLLAALHSVSERVNPRKARPPAPHGPRVLATQRVPICRCWEKSARLLGLSKDQNTESCDLFHPRGHTAMARTGNEAADRGGGGVRCGLRANGDKPRRVVRLPTADSLCDRMERGEEKTNARRRVAFLRTNFADVKARRFLTSGRRKFPSGNFRSARDLEGAKRVSRGQAYRENLSCPRLPGDRTARLRHPQARPLLPANQECPHFLSEPITLPRVIYLIDASVYVFRAYYSMPPEMTDRDGNPAHATFGFARFLGDLIERAKPHYIAVAFDESLTTSFRNQLYPAYKANREPPPADLKQQFASCREF